MAACGGGGSGGAAGGSPGGGNLPTNPPPVVTSQVTAATVVEAAAAGSASIDLVWTAAVSTTAASGLRYEVHVSDKVGFTPTAETARFSGNDVFEARIGGLQAATTYQVQVVASDPNKGTATSKAVSVTTAAAPGELRSGVSFKALEDAAMLAVEPGRVIIAAGVGAPKLGSHIGSAQGKGFLRKVTAVAVLADGRTELTTQPAALADVVSAGSLSTTMSFPAPQAGPAGVAGPRMRVLAARGGRAATVERTWTNSRVTLATRAAADPTSFTFDGSVQLTDTVVANFAPRLQADLKLGVTGVESAKLILQGTASLSQEIAVVAQGAADFDRTVTVIGERAITAVQFIGPVPVVYQGTFSADLRLQAHANGAVSGSTTATMALNDIELGFEYRNGEWVRLNKAALTQHFEVRGSGDATLRVKATLMPKLRLSLNDSVTGQVTATPRLSAGLGVHGEASAMANTTGSRWGADYWLTEGSLTSGMDLYVMGDLSILQRELLVWPSGAKADDLATQQPYVAVPETAVAALPVLQAAANYSAKHPDYPQAVRIDRASQLVPNPLYPLLGPPVFITFGAWTDVVVEDPDGQDAFVIRPPPASADPQELWIEFAQTGTHKVRLGAHGSWGPMARQVVELEVQSRQYVVWSGLSVITQLQKTTVDGVNLYTVDITGSIKGPKGAEMGVAPYFGYRTDVSYTGLPVIRNCGAWTPKFSEDSSGLGCRRGPDDPEQTNFSISGHHWVRDAAGRDTVAFQAGCAPSAQGFCPVLGVLYNSAVVQQAVVLPW